MTFLPNAIHYMVLVLWLCLNHPITVFGCSLHSFPLAISKPGQLCALFSSFLQLQKIVQTTQMKDTTLNITFKYTLRRKTSKNNPSTAHFFITYFGQEIMFLFLTFRSEILYYPLENHFTLRLNYYQIKYI